MELIKRIIIMIAILAVIVGLFVLIFVVDNIGRAMGALLLAGISVGVIVGILGLFITLMEAGMGSDQHAKMAGTLIKVILFVVGMLILTPWFYNHLNL